MYVLVFKTSGMGESLSSPTVKEQIIPVECVAIEEQIHKILWHAFHTTNIATYTIYLPILHARTFHWSKVQNSY